MMKTSVLLPNPKKMELRRGTYILDNKAGIFIALDDKDLLYYTVKRLQGILRDELKLELPLVIEKGGQYRTAVLFERVTALIDEEYMLEILPSHIRIGYSSGAGAFNAVSTLKQLLVQYHRVLPCLVIEDRPDFKARGIMLDISRDKILSMETLFKLIDLMADMKINQLQLMIEGFSFAYPSYPFVWQDGTPVTGEEFMELDRYCRQRYIDLVPNQNSYGHMQAWLERSEFKDLAVAPDGYEVSWMPGVIHKSGSLNPLDSRSLELVNEITSDLLPYFSSEYFHVGCDETFDLHFGKCKEVCEELGIGRVYTDFLLKIHDIVKKHGKKMMFWGDIIIKYPELLNELPKDVTVLEWGYEEYHRFDERCGKLRDAGVDFYVCPGTSCWDAISGRTENMMSNLLSAAENGKRYGASGFLNTDWGDSGHWQYQLFSYPGFAYGAALSWGVDQNRLADICGYLDQYLFRDNSHQMGKLIMQLGNYYLMEKTHRDNVTMIFWTLHVPFDDISVTEGFEKKDYEAIRNYVLAIADELNKVELQCGDAALLEEEFRNAVLFIVHGCNLGILKLFMKNKEESQEVRAHIHGMIEEVTVLIRQHESLWLQRNRQGGLSSSVRQLQVLKAEYEKLGEKYRNLANEIV